METRKKLRKSIRQKWIDRIRGNYKDPVHGDLFTLYYNGRTYIFMFAHKIDGWWVGNIAGFGQVEVKPWEVKRVKTHRGVQQIEID